MTGLAELPRDLVTLEEWDALELDEARRWEHVGGHRHDTAATSASSGRVKKSFAVDPREPACVTGCVLPGK